VNVETVGYRAGEFVPGAKPPAGSHSPKGAAEVNPNTDLPNPDTKPDAIAKKGDDRQLIASA